MEKCTTYLDEGEWYETYKRKKDGIQHILIKRKRDNKPVQVIRFVLQTGKMLKPTEL